MVQPSCPALVIHADDTFRKQLVAALDQANFTVTFADDDGAIEVLRTRTFQVVLVGVDLRTRSGVRALDSLRDGRNCAVIVLGDPDPNIRTLAPWADETMLKPVDPAYVATRARVYCER